MTGRSRREDLKGKACTLAIAFKFCLNSNSFVKYIYICRKKRNLSLECLSLLACSPNRVWYPLGHALFYRWPHMQHEIANCLLVQASSAVYILQQVERGSKHSTAWWSPSFQKKASVFIRFETSPGHFLNFLSLSMSHLATFGHICGHICGHIAQVKPSQHLEGDRPLTTDVTALTSTKIFSCIISSNISCISCLFAWHCMALHGTVAAIADGLPKNANVSPSSRTMWHVRTTRPVDTSLMLQKQTILFAIKILLPIPFAKSTLPGRQRTDFLETRCEVTTQPWLMQSF